MIGNSTCSNSQVTDTQITCDVGDNNAGVYAVVVKNSNGNSNKDKSFTCDLKIVNLSISQGIFFYLTFYLKCFVKSISRIKN